MITGYKLFCLNAGSATCARAILLLLFLVFFNPSSTLASEAVELNDGDLLVVQLSVGAYTDDEPLFVYRNPELTLVPVASIAAILDIAIEADVDTLSVSGWRGSESNTVDLDLRKKQFYSDGVLRPWDDKIRYAEDGFDIYLDQQTVQSLLGIKFAVDVPQLQLRVQEDASIPVLAKLEREKKRELMEKSEIRELPESYIPNTYKWWSVPQFDFSLGSDVENNRGEIDRRYDLFLQGRADLAKHSVNASYIDADGEEDLRITFSRASKGPDEHIALGMDRYEVGDLFGLNDPLVFSSAQGRGVRLSRGGKSVEEQGDVITLQGDAPPGWEAELYRNGSLVEFSNTTDDGRYLFEEVPMFVGENIFDIRLYGPQGQFREIRELVSSGGVMLQQGQWEYDAWALRRNKRLIDSTININEAESDLLMAEARYGFSRSLTAKVGYSQMTPNSNTEERQYVFSSLYGSIGASLAQLHYSQNNDDGTAYQLNLQTRLYETNVNADATYFDDFVSDRNSNGNLEKEYGVRLNRSIFFGLPSAVLTDLDLRHKSFISGDSNSSAKLRTSTGWAGFQLANDLNYLATDGPKVQNMERLDGQLSATRKWEGWRYKGAVDYALSPTGRLSGLSFGASHKFGGNMSYTGNVSHRFVGKDIFSSDHTLSKSFGEFSVSGTTGFSSEGLQYIGLTLTSSLNYNTKDQSYAFAEDSAINSATLNARVFIDENNNKRFDEGEEGVSNIRFKGKSRWRKYQTDEEGLMVVSGLESLTMEKFEVDEKSIEDPFVRSAEPPVYVYTHAGSYVQADIPLAMTFELEGMVFFERQGELSPLDRVRVILEDFEGNAVDVVRVEIDGVYLFTGLLPGEYCIRINKDDLARRDLLDQPESQCFVADGKEGVVFLDDLVYSARL